MRTASVVAIVVVATPMLLAACVSGDGASPGAKGLDPSSVEDAQDGVLSAEEVVAMRKLSPLPSLPPDPTNAFAESAAAADLGHDLFFDPELSGPLMIDAPGLGKRGETGKVACFTCHSSPVTDDIRQPNNVSLGTDYGGRKALPITNSSFYKWTNWGGRFDSQWSLALTVVENPKIMNATRLSIAHRLFDKYRAKYDAAFPVKLDPALSSTAPDAARFPPNAKPDDIVWGGMTPADQAIINRIFANFGKAIAASIRLNISRNTPFDRYVAGDHKAISHSAKLGLKIFVGKGKCVACHSGPNFSDDDFHNEVLPQIGPRVPASDMGRSGDVEPLLASPWNANGEFSDNRDTGKLEEAKLASQREPGRFRTKSLRNLSSSGPYMHAGQLPTLAAVVHYYSTGADGSQAQQYGWSGNGGGGAIIGTKDEKLVPLSLTAEESADLVSFLGSLTGDPVLDWIVKP